VKLLSERGFGASTNLSPKVVFFCTHTLSKSNGHFVILVLELDEMGHEDWLLSRNKIVKLDEYLETWMNRLNESEDKSPIIDWLKNQIEQHKVFLISLLYLDIDCVFKHFKSHCTS
jgi:hypothetical protein